MDARTIGLVFGILLVLGTLTAVIHVLRRRGSGAMDRTLVDVLWSRLRAWWMLFACLAGTFLLGKFVTVIFFGLISFWALREFITLTPTRPADHRTLFWVFFVVTPFQYFLILLSDSWLRSHFGLGTYGLFSIVIPVYLALIVPFFIAISGDPTRFLERTAKIQTGLLICVYCLSYAPALLTMEVAGLSEENAILEARRQAVEAIGDEQDVSSDDKEEPEASSELDNESTTNDSEEDITDQTESSEADEDEAEEDVEEDQSVVVSSKNSEDDKESEAPFVLTQSHRLRLLVLLIMLVQLSEAFQHAWSRLPSRHYVATTIHSTRTWEGFVCGTATTALCGALLFWATPFEHVWQAVIIAAAVSFMGMCGGLMMSAVKRDRGVSDYGTLVEGHSGVLDRMDALCFAAPVFYHMAYMFLAVR
jgi:phosphatidate cytidylyltransferase